MFQNFQKMQQMNQAAQFQQFMPQQEVYAEYGMEDEDGFAEEGFESEL